jgi:hypothetical protein
MNRREAFGLFAKVGAVSAVAACGGVTLKVESVKKYGYLTPNLCREHGIGPPSKIRVLLDGVERQSDAVVCDDVEGYIEVYNRKPPVPGTTSTNRGYYTDPRTGNLARTRLYGHVVFKVVE